MLIRGLVGVVVAVFAFVVVTGRGHGHLADAGIWAAALFAVSSWVAPVLERVIRPEQHFERLAIGHTALDALTLTLFASALDAPADARMLAWGILLWVPFSAGLRLRTLGAGLATGATMLLVVACSGFDSASERISAPEPSGVVVPLLLLLGAGIATNVARTSQRRETRGMRRLLASEQGVSARLREADDLKNTFLAAVSHEIRTPLTSILGFSVTLLDRTDLPAERRDEMLRMLVQEAEHLDDILENLLDLDRLTRGKATLVPSEVRPDDIVTRVVDVVRQRSGRAIHLRIVGHEQLLLDAAKVERIVENLVGNAVKYTDRDVAIEVLVTATPDCLTIQVDDEGEGIARDLRETIFEPFKRGRSRGVPGTGI
ncbi:MAG: phoR 1, partial [Thermoleophilia bacterium]|nr:phoR 1 [Thermoleophilia bacterium]